MRRASAMRRVVLFAAVSAVGACGEAGEQRTPWGAGGKGDSPEVGTSLQRFGSGNSLAAFLEANLPAPVTGGQGGGGGGEAATAELDSITHTQESGVDEGGIVKAHGDHFVVLRRGQLFTVATRDGATKTLKPTAYVTVDPTVCDQSVPVRHYRVNTTLPLRLRDKPSTRTGKILTELRPRQDWGGGEYYYTCVRRDCSRAPTADGWLPLIDSDSGHAGWALQGSGGETWLEPSEQCASYYSGVWYDELLVKDDTLVVVGYNYERKATELSLFDIDATGQITRVADGRYFFSSNDYYSGSNYMSRLVDGKLVFYMPYYLYRGKWDATVGEYGALVYEPAPLPAVQQGNMGPWQPLIEETQIYMPPVRTTLPTLYTVLTCDLRPSLKCTSRGIVGPASWNTPYYVSRDAIYLWLTGESAAGPGPAAVVRMPTSGGSLTAVLASGTPTDQFSFKQDASKLHVLVRAGRTGDGGYFEASRGPVNLVTIPLSAFSTALQRSTRVQTVELPGPEDAWSLKNRFVGDHVIYGQNASYWWGAEEPDRNAYVYNYVASAGAAHAVPLSHNIARIEPMGDRAVVLGQNGDDLVISAISLDATPEVSAERTEPDAMQSEQRSHAYYFEPQQGIMAIPAVTWGEGAQGVGDARMLFFGVKDRSLKRLGELVATPSSAQCVSSCYDWYGNARPIFYDGRIFALLGYELLEGQLVEIFGARWLRRLRRVDFSSLL